MIPKLRMKKDSIAFQNYSESIDKFDHFSREKFHLVTIWLHVFNKEMVEILPVIPWKFGNFVLLVGTR